MHSDCAFRFSQQLTRTRRQHQCSSRSTLALQCTTAAVRWKFCSSCERSSTLRVKNCWFRLVYCSVYGEVQYRVSHFCLHPLPVSRLMCLPQEAVSPYQGLNIRFQLLCAYPSAAERSTHRLSRFRLSLKATGSLYWPQSFSPQLVKALFFSAETARG